MEFNLCGIVKLDVGSFIVSVKQAINAVPIQIPESATDDDESLISNLCSALVSSMYFCSVVVWSRNAT